MTVESSLMNEQRSKEIEATRQAVAAELRSRRAYKRVTQSQVVKESGISASLIERLESGRRDMSIDELVTLGRVLDFNPVEFMSAVQVALHSSTEQDA